MPGAQRTAIGITGNQGAVEQDALDEMAGVAEVIRVSKPYKLVSRDVKEEDTVIRFPGTDATIGGRDLAIMAGPCSIESREQAFAVAEQVAAGRSAVSSAAARTSRAPHLTPSRAWAKTRCRSWPKFASASGCGSSPRRWTTNRWSWSSSMPT